MLKFKLAFILVLTFAFGGFITVGSAQAETLKLCYLEWGKFGGKKLPEKGFIPDAMTRILTHAGYQVEVSIRPWNRCIEQTKAMDFDLVADAWKGPTFDNDFDYLRVHHIDAINFVALKTSDIKDGNIESMKGRRVGYLGTSGGLEKFYKNQDIFAQVSKVNSEAAMLRVLLKDRVDVIVSDPLQLLAVADTIEQGLSEKLAVLDPPLQLNYGAALISKNHPKKEEIKAAFDKAFRELAKTDMYEKLSAKHDIQIRLPSIE